MGRILALVMLGLSVAGCTATLPPSRANGCVALQMSALVATQQGCATQLTPYVAVTDLHEQGMVLWKLHSVEDAPPIVAGKKIGLIFFAHREAAPVWATDPRRGQVTLYGNHPSVGAAIFEMTTGLSVPSRNSTTAFIYGQTHQGLLLAHTDWTGVSMVNLEGFSGGPAVDGSGRVVGVTYGGFTKSVGKFAVGDAILFSARFVVNEYDKLKATGKYPWMKGEPRVVSAGSRPVAVPAPAVAGTPEPESWGTAYQRAMKRLKALSLGP